MATDEPLHLQIIALAEGEAGGKLAFSPAALGRLERQFVSLLESEGFAAHVAEFVRAVAAFQAGGQARAAKQLMDLGTQVVEKLSAEHATPAEKLKSAVTGAENLARMRPVGAGPAPLGSVKATAFIRPPPKQRG